MISDIRLLHYLTEDTYRLIARKLGLSEESPHNREDGACFAGDRIYRVKLFNIIYKQFGHIWFMYTFVDFDKFHCAYADFSGALYSAYDGMLGSRIMDGFPAYDAINCDYVAYRNSLRVDDADAVMDGLRGSGKYPPEQLDRARWDAFKKPHGTIEFCIDRQDESHLATLARCHGTAMKKRVDSKYHRSTGVTPAKIVNEQTERELLRWLCGRYGLTCAEE